MPVSNLSPVVLHPVHLGASQQASSVSMEQIVLDRRPETMHQSEIQFSGRFRCELFLQLLQEWQHLLHGHNS